MYYYGARYYDPALGIFREVDPAMDAYPGWSPYAYTLDNPLRYVDPDGQFVWIPIILGALAGVFFTSDYANAPGPEENTYSKSTSQKVFETLVAVATGYTVGKIVLACHDIADDPNLQQQQGPNPPGTDAAKIGDKASDAGKAGRYEFESASGKTYVGQSKDMPNKIRQHVNDGKISQESAQKAKMTPVDGGKTAREIAEQKRINELGGIEKLENKRNAIGKSRDHLLKE